MKKWKFIWIGLLVLTCNNIAWSQSKAQLLSKSLQGLYEKDSLPGMSVVLVDAHKIVYQHNFGYANMEQHTKYSSHSIQNIGSVSKTFIAVALMKAVELGYFNLDADINTILPFKITNPNAPNGIITIRHLSNHSSGIVDNPSVFPNVYHFDTDLAPFDSSAYKVLQELGYRQQVSDSALGRFMYDYLSTEGKYYHQENFGKDAPGLSSSYSNIASALAAYLIEIKSGMPYADFVTKYILKPLGMPHSAWKLNKADLKDYARPYYKRNAAFPYYHFITYPEGGLRTNTLELSKYIMAMIKGYHGDESLLKNSSYKTMFSPQFSANEPPKGISLAKRNKGIFWNLYTNGTIGHDGDDPGVSSFLFFNPKTGLGGIFMCNKYLEDKTAIINLLVQYTDEK
ncbi:serine hydrolase domain-containing protein [Pedobacter roseus]|uniref:Serine hydrolase n=1 Tax=Pedobacter roseus TaxID=336820 RepID=A0A7G9QN46_9SPHI|nr:serine hydrolase domain-containing protein [Pedobacter roseus]QNN44771.1 serine hydrolase [Pedobacter roseus]